MKRIEYFKGKGGRWFFRCVAANGEIVGTSTESDGYADESHARRGAEASMHFWTDGTPIEASVVTKAEAAETEESAPEEPAAPRADKPRPKKR